MPLFLGGISPGETHAFMCPFKLPWAIPPDRVDVFEVYTQKIKNKRKPQAVRYFRVSKCRHQRAACVDFCRCPQGLCIPAFVHPGWLYLQTTATVPYPSLTASGASRASLVVEITRASIRRQVQSKSKKVLHTGWR